MKTIHPIVIALVIIAIVVALYTTNHKVALAPTPSPLPITTLSPTPSSNALIVVENPQPGEKTSHTLEVRGKARGLWYFEGSFPIRIEDSKGNSIAHTAARAQSDWMTSDFVPFTATLQLPASYTGNATLVAEKDNPSGLPQNAASIKIPIIIQ